MTLNLTRLAEQKLLSNLPKHRNNPYLEFVRTRPCLICGQGDVHAHHVRMGSHAGLGTKPSDYLCVPLCFKHHDELHNKGEKTFWQTHQIPPHIFIIKMLGLYLSGKESVDITIHALTHAIEDTRL